MSVHETHCACGYAKDEHRMETPESAKSQGFLFKGVRLSDLQKQADSCGLIYLCPVLRNGVQYIYTDIGQLGADRVAPDLPGDRDEDTAAETLARRAGRPRS